MIGSTLLAMAIVGVNVGSHHPGNNTLNDSNPGIYAMTQTGYGGGLYLNSHSRMSVWAGRMWSTERVQVGPVGVSAAILAGGVTGYGPGLTPLVSPSIAATSGKYTARLSYAPKHPTKPGASDAFHLSFEVSIQ